MKWYLLHKKLFHLFRTIHRLAKVSSYIERCNKRKDEDIKVVKYVINVIIIYTNLIPIAAAVMNEGAVFLTINHQNYPSVKLAGLGFLANRSYKGQRTLKMAGNGSSARLKISGVKNHKKMSWRIFTSWFPCGWLCEQARVDSVRGKPSGRGWQGSNQAGWGGCDGFDTKSRSSSFSEISLI